MVVGPLLEPHFDLPLRLGLVVTAEIYRPSRLKAVPHGAAVP